MSDVGQSEHGATSISCKFHQSTAKSVVASDVGLKNTHTGTQAEFVRPTYLRSRSNPAVTPAMADL